MKLLACAALMAASMAVNAAPFLYSQVLPAVAVQPDTATYTVDGGAPISCQILVDAANGKQAKCDLGQLTAAKDYIIVMTWVKQASITNSPNKAINAAGSSASSDPFTYALQLSPVAKPTLSVMP